MNSYPGWGPPPWGQPQIVYVPMPAPPGGQVPPALPPKSVADIILEAKSNAQQWDDLVKSLQKEKKDEKKDDDKKKKSFFDEKFFIALSWLMVGSIPVTFAQIGFLHLIEHAFK